MFPRGNVEKKKDSPLFFFSPQGMGVHSQKKKTPPRALIRDDFTVIRTLLFLPLLFCLGFVHYLASLDSLVAFGVPGTR